MICFSNTQEWDDVRLQAARKGVADAIAGGVHKFMVLNLDQVWGQSLRFSAKVLVKGVQRAMADEGCRFFCA